MVTMASFKIKDIVVFCAFFRFPIKFICFVALGSASEICCLRKSVGVIF